MTREGYLAKLQGLNGIREIGLNDPPFDLEAAHIAWRWFQRDLGIPRTSYTRYGVLPRGYQGAVYWGRGGKADIYIDGFIYALHKRWRILFHEFWHIGLAHLGLDADKQCAAEPQGQEGARIKQCEAAFGRRGGERMDLERVVDRLAQQSLAEWLSSDCWKNIVRQWATIYSEEYFREQGWIGA